MHLVGQSPVSVLGAHPSLGDRQAMELVGVSKICLDAAQLATDLSQETTLSRTEARHPAERSPPVARRSATPRVVTLPASHATPDEAATKSGRPPWARRCSRYDPLSERAPRLHSSHSALPRNTSMSITLRQAVDPPNSPPRPPRALRARARHEDRGQAERPPENVHDLDRYEARPARGCREPPTADAGRGPAHERGPEAPSGTIPGDPWR